MKRLLLLFLSIVAIPFAGELYCNDGSTDLYGIPPTACLAVSTNFTFGLLQDFDGSTNYYFIDFHDILLTIGSEENVPLRFIIYSNEPNYHSMQALTQTAFATNAKLSVIFENPELSQNLTTTAANGRKVCYRYGGTGSSMVCHVDALTIQR